MRIDDVISELLQTISDDLDSGTIDMDTYMHRSRALHELHMEELGISSWVSFDDRYYLATSIPGWRQDVRNGQLYYSARWLNYDRAFRSV